MTVTPSPQSVVVPVEPTGAMILAGAEVKGMVDVYGCVGNPDEVWSAMLAAAPAPSSLAGGEGEIEMIARAIDPDAWAHIDACHEAMKTCGEDKLPDFRKVIERRLHNSESIPAAERVIASLAALSPEAPARDEVDERRLRWAVVQMREVLSRLQHSDNAADFEESRVAGVTIGDAVLTPRHEAPSEPVSDHYKFDDEIAWLREAARYFSVRETKGEDRAHWANVYNAESARKLADRLAELSSNPCQLEAPASEGDES